VSGTFFAGQQARHRKKVPDTFSPFSPGTFFGLFLGLPVDDKAAGNGYLVLERNTTR
jgi:hypothetical protein